MPMPNNRVENIVHLPSARRSNPVPSLHLPRTQPMSPVLFTQWVTVRDRAAAALLGGTQRLLLTGAAGTGKTVLIEHVARVLRAAGRTVIIQLADADPAPPGPGVTLFVDEADRLSAPKLKQLLGEAAGAVVLTGLAPLVRRVPTGTVHLALEPLGPAEAQAYIAQWLALNGRTSAELDSKAVRVLVDVSGGVPRLLSTLLAAGAWLAKTGSAPVIEASHIKEAAELRSVLGPPAAREIAIVERPPERSALVSWSASLTGVVLLGIAAATALHLFPAQTDRAVALASPVIKQAERWLRPEPGIPPAPTHLEPVSQPVAPAVPIHQEPTAPSPAPEQAPDPVTSAPAIAAPVAASMPTLPVETAKLLLRRGREMLAIDDLSAARLLFLRAAEGGSRDAMFELGRTYDAAFLNTIGAVQQADRAEALRWYHQAAATGDRTAERQLQK